MRCAWAGKKLQAQVRLLIFTGLVLVAVAFPCAAAVAPHRVRVDLHLSSRPVQGSARKESVLFTQKAQMSIYLFNFEAASTNIVVQSVILYEDISSAGKRKSRHILEEFPLSMKKNEDRTLRGEEFLLTGKVNRLGSLSGMRLTGYAVRITESGKTIYECAKPEETRKLSSRWLVGDPLKTPERPGEKPSTLQ